VHHIENLGVYFALRMTHMNVPLSNFITSLWCLCVCQGRRTGGSLLEACIYGLAKGPDSCHPQHGPGDAAGK